MNNQIATPTIISALRIVVLPLFVYFYDFGNVAFCLGLLVFCVATDFLDGYVARKLNVASRFGAYFDALTDFILTFGVFVLFTIDGHYSFWLPLLIAASFVQFLITSYYTKRLYDPVGKYLGSALYIGIFLTLLWPMAGIFAFVQYAFVAFFLVSLASRLISLTRKPQP